MHSSVKFLGAGIVILLLGLGILWSLLEPTSKEASVLLSKTNENKEASFSLTDEKQSPEEEKVKKEKQHEKDVVALRVALRDGNDAMCDRIMEVVQKTNCHESLLAETAFEKKDTKYCEKIYTPLSRSNCFDRVLLEEAIYYRDFSLCDKISRADTQKECFDLHSDALLLNATNISDCMNIPSETHLARCRDFFLQKSITKKEDRTPRECDRLSTPEMKKECYVQITAVAAQKENNILLCNELKEPSLQKRCLNVVKSALDAYFFEEALTDKNTEICEQILDLTMRTSCVDRLLFLSAKTTLTPKKCTEITEEMLKKRCTTVVRMESDLYFLGEARRTKDPQFCENIFNEEKRSSCVALWGE